MLFYIFFMYIKTLLILFFAYDAWDKNKSISIISLKINTTNSYYSVHPFIYHILLRIKYILFNIFLQKRKWFRDFCFHSADRWLCISVFWKYFLSEVQILALKAVHDLCSFCPYCAYANKMEKRKRKIL
jgi:hypothetical protein